jgi:hypothetical protein
VRKRKQPATAEELEAAARQIGLWERVQEVGWDGLSAAEAGRLGAWVQRLRRPAEEAEAAEPEAAPAPAAWPAGEEPPFLPDAI